MGSPKDYIRSAEVTGSRRTVDCCRLAVFRCNSVAAYLAGYPAFSITGYPVHRRTVLVLRPSNCRGLTVKIKNNLTRK